MSLLKIVKTLNYKQLKSLCILFFRHPLFMVATIWATYATLKIAEEEFPEIHNLHNKANAFRHALWNILIVRYSLKISRDFDKVISWTKRITDWHEDFSPNEIMARKMDLQNNAFGRDKFKSLQKASIPEIILGLKQELKNAVLVSKETDFEKNTNCLVYLEV
jgi:hypothetical protein